MNPNEPKKDIVYIDIDDEITAIIEKLQTSPQKIVALVLPKRASVLQSAVNMKLLKRMADTAKKHVVLITNEAGLLPLAGAAGLHVASSLQSRPTVPPTPGQLADTFVDEDTGDDITDFDTTAAAATPIGSLAGLPPEPAAATANNYTEPETIELDNEDEAPLAASAATVPTKKMKKNTGTDKKLKVPNFNKFRIILISAIVLLLLLGGGFAYASVALSKAEITLKTNSSDITTKATVTLDPKATEADDDTLPAKIASKQATASQQVATTGQKNNGTKASGTVIMSSQVCGAGALTATSPGDVPSGTGISSGNKTFITQQRATFPESGVFKSGCVTYTATSTTNVLAQAGGADSNVAASSFTVAGRPELTAKSSDTFSGGTDNIVKIVAQADIDSAKSKLSAQDASGVKDELTTQLSSAGYQAIASSLHTGEATVTPSAKVGDQTDTVSVTQATTYTLYGVHAADLKKIVTDNVNKQIDTTKQQILQDGLNKAKYSIGETTATGPVDVVLTATSLAGPDIDATKLAAQLAGKQTGDVQSIVTAIPGVSDVSVKYSPFWVSKVPKNVDKIAIVIEKATGGNATLQSADD